MKNTYANLIPPPKLSPVKSNMESWKKDLELYTCRRCYKPNQLNIGHWNSMPNFTGVARLELAGATKCFWQEMLDSGKGLPEPDSQANLGWLGCIAAYCSVWPASLFLLCAVVVLALTDCESYFTVAYAGMRNGHIVVKVFCLRVTSSNILCTMLVQQRPW